MKGRGVYEYGRGCETTTIKAKHVLKFILQQRNEGRNKAVYLFTSA